MAAVVPLPGCAIIVLGSAPGLVLAVSLSLVLLATAWLLDGLEVHRRRAPGVLTGPAAPG